MIIGIVAIDRNNAIGKQGKLPWHYSADLRHFKTTTIGHAIVMGANTWESIGRPLPDRLNIVLTRSGMVHVPDEVVKIHSVDHVLAIARRALGHVYVIGGAEVFAAFRPHIERWVVTDIPMSVENADTFLPSGTFEGFEQTASEDIGEGLIVRTLDRVQN